MGDVGSATLGLITFALAIIGQQRYHIPIWYWFLLNGLFLFDSTCTLIRRILYKEKWFAPHRKHAYQRLRQSGTSVSRILFGQLVLNLLALLQLFLLNIIFLYPFVVILVQFGIIFSVYCAIEKIFPMDKSQFTR